VCVRKCLGVRLSLCVSVRVLLSDYVRVSLFPAPSGDKSRPLIRRSSHSTSPSQRNKLPLDTSYPVARAAPQSIGHPTASSRGWMALGTRFTRYSYYAPQVYTEVRWNEYQSCVHALVCACSRLCLCFPVCVRACIRACACVCLCV